MIDALTCGANGWLMLAAGVLTYGTLAWPVRRLSNTSSSPTAAMRPADDLLDKQPSGAPRC